MNEKIPLKKIDFRPFRAWRYNASRVPLSRVLAPPYDVISPAERESLYAASPYNVVRLILGKEPNFYELAAAHWEAWSEEGILVQEEKPAFYLYEQSFRHPWDSRPMRRLALAGILKLGTEGSVLPHEATFAAPKKDRLQLLEKTETNLSPIFGLHPDPDGMVSEIGGLYRNSPPAFEAEDLQKTAHRVWRIESEPDQRKIRELLSGTKILIADGHHRYETAVEYRRKRREESPGLGEAPFDFVMMALAAFEDEGLLVLPTHRMIRGLGAEAKEKFLGEAPRYFDFMPVPEEKLFPELLGRPAEEKVFGAHLGKEGNFLLRLKDSGRVRPLLPPGKPELWYELETNLLTSFVFQVLWGLAAGETEKCLEYTRASEEAAARVRTGGAEAAFLLRPPAISTVLELAVQGERMPEKTTYFYPKLASGLFFYRH